MRAQGLIGLGSIASTRGNYFSALEMFNTSLGIAHDASDHRSHATALAGISQVHFARGEYEHAIRTATQAEQLAETSGHRATIASVMSARLVVLAEVGEAVAARELADRALRLRMEIGQTAGVVSAMTNIAGLKINARDITDVMKPLDRALELSLEENLQWSKANILILMVAVHHLQGDHGQSIEVNLEALSLFEAIGDKGAIANALNNLALSHFAIEDIDEAWSATSRALTVYEELGTPRGLAIALHNTAGIQFRRGNPAEAGKLAGRAGALNEKLGKKEAQAANFALIAASRQQAGDHEGELEFLVKSKEIFDTLAESPPDDWNLDSRIRTCRSHLSQTGIDSPEDTHQDSPPGAVLEIGGCAAAEVIAWVKGNMGASADHYLLLTASQLLWIEENVFTTSESKKHAAALETIGPLQRTKGLVADSLVISSGGQLPERPFEHWRTKRKNIATLFRATGKQVTAGSERDSSFQLTAIT